MAYGRNYVDTKKSAARVNKAPQSAEHEYANRFEHVTDTHTRCTCGKRSPKADTKMSPVEFSNICLTQSKAADA